MSILLVDLSNRLAGGWVSIRAVLLHLPRCLSSFTVHLFVHLEKLGWELIEATIASTPNSEEPVVLSRLLHFV